MSDFRLSSSAFQHGESIPVRFTCDGEDVSPDLAWTGAPPETVAFVLFVDDPDADHFVHWTLLDFTGADSGAIPAGFSSSPDAPRQGMNGFGRIGWGGPCPPSGSHRYRFVLYALGAELGLSGAPDPGEIRDALAEADVLAQATLEGRYMRRGR